MVNGQTVFSYNETSLADKLTIVRVIVRVIVGVIVRVQLFFSYDHPQSSQATSGYIEASDPLK